MANSRVAANSGICMDWRDWRTGEYGPTRCGARQRVRASPLAQLHWTVTGPPPISRLESPKTVCRRCHVMRRRAVIVRCGWGAAVGVCVLAILAIAGGQDHTPLSPETLPSKHAGTAATGLSVGSAPARPRILRRPGRSPAADASRGQPVITAEARSPATIAYAGNSARSGGPRGGSGACRSARPRCPPTPGGHAVRRAHSPGDAGALRGHCTPRARAPQPHRPARLRPARRVGGRRRTDRARGADPDPGRDAERAHADFARGLSRRRSTSSRRRSSCPRTRAAAFALTGRSRPRADSGADRA